MKRIAFLMMLPAAAHAGGFEVSEQTAVSAGTAGAGTARAGDPGAAWHDPAALADDGGWRFDVSLIFARPTLEARALDGSWAQRNAAEWQTPPHLDLSYAQGPWAAGISLGVPFGSGVTWPDGWAGRDEIIATKLQVFRAAPFVAWSFGALRVAAGVHADFGRMQIQRDLDFIDMQGDVAIDMDGHGFGVDASAFWQARHDLALGAIYRSRTHLAMHGGADFTAPDAFGGKIPDQHASSNVTLPDQLAVGARYTHGALALLADVEVTMWSTSDKLVVDFEQMQTPDVTQQQQWHDTVSVRAGTEWTRGRLTLRDGAYLEQSPAPAKTLAPTAPDGTRLGVSAGASWRMTRALSVDGFVELMWLLRRDTGDVDALQASYGGRATLAGVGVRWTP